MDLLDTIPTLSIAELRKVLKDNDVRETGSSKEELKEQVSQVLLTNIMVQEMMEQDHPPSVKHPPVKPPSVKPINEEPPIDSRTLERLQQDQEYEQSVVQDMNQQVMNQQPEQPEQLSNINEEQISLEDLRQLRLMYFNSNIA